MQARVWSRPPLGPTHSWAPPTAGAAPPLFTLEGISLDCKYFNSQKLKEGVGQGLGWCDSRLSLFIQAFSVPVSDNSILRHAVVRKYRTHNARWAPMATPGRPVPCQLLQVSGVVTGQGEPETGPFTASAQPLGRGGTGAPPL